MKANNTIHINGKTYDARTGELLSAVKQRVVSASDVVKTAVQTKTKPTQAVKQMQKSPKRGNGFVDGIARHPNAPKHSIPSKSKTVTPNTATTTKKSGSVHNIAPVHRVIHRSATLNRAGVKAPKITAPESSVKKSVERKSATTPAHRLERAYSTEKSPIISHFNRTFAQTTREPKAQHTSAVLSMSHIAKAAEKARRANHMQRVKHELIAKSLAEANKMSKQHAHKQQKSHTRGTVSAVAGVMAAIVLAGYVAYLNVPSLSVKFASSRAGFAATVPSQTPAGYSLKRPIAYSPGQVILNFGSNTDGRHFSVQQQPSTWDSEALKENFVAKNTSTEPMTYQDNGLTIYIYDGGNAAWVNNGKFYSIKSSNSGLDTQQVLDIATSM